MTDQSPDPAGDTLESLLVQIGEKEAIYAAAAEAVRAWRPSDRAAASTDEADG